MLIRILMIWCCFQPAILSGQGFVVANDKMNVAYVGVDNPLTIIAEGYPCGQLSASCDNGILEKKEGCCYNFRPQKQGTFEIVIKAKRKGKLVDVGCVKYRVWYLPDPELSLGRTGHFARFLNAGPKLTTPGIDFHVNFEILDFTFEVVRDKKLIYSEHNPGSTYTQKNKNFLNSLRSGDMVLVKKLRCQGPDSQIRTLEPVSYQFL